MIRPGAVRWAVQRVMALVAAGFGMATLVAGGRVLAGANPGYVVFRPLLLFNTAMGVAYLAAGILTWLSPRLGRVAATAIFLLNLVVLAAVGALHAAGAAVAIDSVRAMTFRTLVWLVLLLGLCWLLRRRPLPAAHGDEEGR